MKELRQFWQIHFNDDTLNNPHFEVAFTVSRVGRRSQAGGETIASWKQRAPRGVLWAANRDLFFPVPCWDFVESQQHRFLTPGQYKNAVSQDEALERLETEVAAFQALGWKLKHRALIPRPEAKYDQEYAEMSRHLKIVYLGAPFLAGAKFGSGAKPLEISGHEVMELLEPFRLLCTVRGKLHEPTFWRIMGKVGIGEKPQ